ncbi:glycoside hydrolase family 3 protein, partial [Vibrio breoganii]
TSPESYKGIVFVQGEPQNLENYLDGTLEFELYVETYGTPANEGENATQGLVIKMESPEGPGDDLLLPRADYPVGEWHKVSVPMSQLNTGSLNINNVNTPLASLPSWNASQAGFTFTVRNIELIK